MKERKKERKKKEDINLKLLYFKDQMSLKVKALPKQTLALDSRIF